ncbi:MAG: hypothetical protein IOD12_12590, partial [Silvanigrellales bacterium]|nr:hypothetical protein [Silvanigrellales bacterium]
GSKLQKRGYTNTGYVKDAQGTYRTEKYVIKRVIPHPSYPPPSDGETGDALDLALVLVDGRNVNVFANLPSPSGEQLKKGAELWLYGHGHTGAKDGKFASDGVLRAAKFEALSVKTKGPYPQVVLESKENVQSCGIDSGSPYLQKMGDAVVQVGVHTGGSFMSPSDEDELVRLMKIANPTPIESERLISLRAVMKERSQNHTQSNCTKYPSGAILSQAGLDWLRAQIMSPVTSPAGE